MAPRLAVALLALGLVLVGCAARPPTDKPLVVASTTQLGDFAREVGGGAVTVHQVLQPNTDPHEYEPRPDDIVASADAKVVLVSGDGLDGWMDAVVRAAGGHPRVVTISDVIKMDRPHWWHDPRNVIAAVARIRAALSAAVPQERRTFARNAARYTAKLRRLDAGIERCFASLPRSQRKLVTSHDAFGYFAKRYGVHVIGAIIPSQSTEAEPSAGDVARLARQVRTEHVHAIFLESSTNGKLGHAVARETHTLGNLTLYGDSLGPRGSAGATYLGMERANADAMLRGFTAGRRGCRIHGIG